ncbi:sugar ABC transporter substrate-binding protein [Blastococcus haudaquaticus]|uniref:Monosaccharide ABC transporter substrate-binding protein, CUT2 family n=1 Tax=Blastococcus haudaquaticus TaxID=1938745 RepID=A0A286H2T5_9ACTN|nr:sugar ABC transporter substrate-binding protein [Blastococcus haudaquaticus]SOE02067.1 monosaccharide ABC transporter substrate-binding protein, CUT2 family [Blastococcus haudaquaticus]
MRSLLTAAPSRRRNAVVAFAITSTMALTAACGSEGGGDSGSGGSAEEVDLSFVYATSTINAMQEMALGAKAAAAEREGVNYSEAAPAGINGPQQVSMFQSAMQTSKDGILFETLTPDLFTRPLEQATSSDIPIVSIDTAPPEGSGVEFFVGNSNEDVGRILAEELVRQLPEGQGGKVVLANAIPGLPTLEERLAGMVDVLKTERPDLEIVGPLATANEPTENYNAWNNLLKAHPDAVAYLGAGAQDSVSLARLHESTGGTWLGGACDLDPAALEGLKNGHLFAISSPEHWLKGYIGLRLLALNAQEGEELPTGWWNPGELLVTADNVDEIIERQTDEASRLAWFEDVAEEQFANMDEYLTELEN